MIVSFEKKNSQVRMSASGEGTELRDEAFSIKNFCMNNNAKGKKILCLKNIISDVFLYFGDFKKVPLIFRVDREVAQEFKQYSCLELVTYSESSNQVILKIL